MEKVQDLIKEIHGLDTRTASKKDEVRVMKALMNDKGYKVAVFNREGQVGYICPSQELRQMCASVMSTAAKIPQVEADHLMEDHEFKRSEAEHMIEFSKEFINTYIHTGRKLPLGGRELSSVSLAIKPVPAGERTYPKQIGFNEDGSKKYQSGKSYVQNYESIRVYAPVPAWRSTKKD